MLMLAVFVSIYDKNWMSFGSLALNGIPEGYNIMVSCLTWGMEVVHFGQLYCIVLKKVAGNTV